MKIELEKELHNEFFKIQVNEIELEGRYLFIRGIVLDIDKNMASEFEDSLDMLDFCCADEETEEIEITDIEDLEKRTSVEETSSV